MSDVRAPLPKDDPRLMAWERYTREDDYANTRKWALRPEAVDGSLWAAFIAGWNAATDAAAPAEGTDVKTCPRCRHRAHIGTCTHTTDTSAYRCGCTLVTVAATGQAPATGYPEEREDRELLVKSAYVNAIEIKHALERAFAEIDQLRKYTVYEIHKLSTEYVRMRDETIPLLREANVRTRLENQRIREEKAATERTARLLSKELDTVREQRDRWRNERHQLYTAPEEDRHE